MKKFFVVAAGALLIIAGSYGLAGHTFAPGAPVKASPEVNTSVVVRPWQAEQKLSSTTVGSDGELEIYRWRSKSHGIRIAATSVSNCDTGDALGVKSSCADSHVWYQRWRKKKSNQNRRYTAVHLVEEAGWAKRPVGNTVPSAKTGNGDSRIDNICEVGQKDC
jgi:hypothetical protein